MRKHYFRELRSRLEARQRLEGKMLMALLGQVEAGNVSAIDKLYKRLDKHDLVLLGERVSNRGDHRPRPQPKLGKKEQQRQAAGEVSGKFAPPQAPARLIN